MILYFTGTGNSRIIAERLGELLETRVVKLLPSMADGLPAVDCAGEKSMIWVFPIHSWGLPNIVRRIISGITIVGAQNVRHHLVVTCGDDCGYADRIWKKDIESRGWQTGSVFSIPMPNTYVSLPYFDVDSPEVVKKKLGLLDNRTSLIAESLKKEQDRTEIIRGAFAWVKTYMIYPYFMKHLILPEKFKVSDKCISCGRCVKICPENNVSLNTDHRPVWGKDCCGCLACYHICPRHAIEYGRFTKDKGQYISGLSLERHI